MSEDPKQMARAHRQAAARNPAKATQHNLAADILDPPPAVPGENLRAVSEVTSRGQRWVSAADFKPHPEPRQPTPSAARDWSTASEYQQKKRIAK
jgi:hypothetical protein